MSESDSGRPSARDERQHLARVTFEMASLWRRSSSDTPRSRRRTKRLLDSELLGFPDSHRHRHRHHQHPARFCDGAHTRDRHSQRAGVYSSNNLLQFLVAAVVLCIADGAVGVALGSGASAALRHSLGWDTAMSPTAITLAFAFAALIGIVFGVWPARRAAVLDPNTALRYE